MIKRVIYALVLLSGMDMMSSVFIYAPGVAAPWSDHNKTVKDVCRAMKSLHIFAEDAQLDVNVDLDARMVTVTDPDTYHVAYAPVFVDYYAGTGVRNRYIAQERDLADLYYVHAHVTTHHSGPIHMLGHSRGGGTIATYVGLLWYDRPYLHELAHRYWPEVTQYEMCNMQMVDARVMSQLGTLCLIGAFDNLGETVHNVVNALHMPEFIQEYLFNDPQALYHRISGMIPVPQYNWEAEATPRAMVAHIPPYVPCICVHTDRDPINPPAVARDMYATRNMIAPDRSYLHIVPNTMTLPFQHLEVPYFRDVPDVAKSLQVCIDLIECEYAS